MKAIIRLSMLLSLLLAATNSFAWFFDSDDWECYGPYGKIPDCNPYDEWDPRYWMEEMDDDDDDWYRYGGYGYGPYGGYGMPYGGYGMPYGGYGMPYGGYPPAPYGGYGYGYQQPYGYQPYGAPAQPAPAPVQPATPQ